ncbi:hypothetical protein [Aeromonas veronii]|uniref:hypothetical protein n=1 Tax=Aeromonas veronii TaxID=654 RepID=UPI003D237BAC
MRIGWLLLFFPSLAFAIGGCPVGVQLGSVTIATKLPACIKFEQSTLGGCIANCQNICVELPLANTKGPVITTGNECSWNDTGTEGGGGNGDADGSGNTPDEGSGTGGNGFPKDWDYFKPVLGDATGTSVSAAVAKLNSNIGKYISTVTGTRDQDSANLNLIAHSTESFSRDMKTSLYHLDRMSSDLFKINNTISPILGNTNTANDYLQSINLKMDKNSGSGSGSVNSQLADDVSSMNKKMEYAMGMWASDKASLMSINSQMSSVLRDGGSAAASLSAIRGSVLSIRDSVAAGGSGSGGDSGGSSIDYSKMPGTADNPMSVKSSSYKSACTGEDCFFDVAGIQKQLDAANDSLKEKYSDIGNEVKEVFNFQLSGSAGVIDCFDLFSYAGKEYQVCPPSKDYWQTLAALMMFIFYFMALMLIFKR